MKIGLYAHGGSGNHGCEALVRSTVRLLGDQEYTLLSERPEEDYSYGLDGLTQIVPSQTDLPTGLRHIVYTIRMKFRQNDALYWRMRYRCFEKSISDLDLDLALAIGGDNYCYSGFSDRFSILNRMMVKERVPIILWGCSIDKERMCPKMLGDLKRYRLIVARESITFETLKDAGLDNVRLIPDAAFLLEEKDSVLPDGFIPDNMVGLNISPLIIRQETAPGITMQNCRRLIDTILKKTDMGVALIPHVVWEGNDDRIPLKELHEEYQSSGRVLMIDDTDVMTLKGIIHRCRFMVAARTHASIAGYSTGVPTLVLGYSVKSRGIALDLFGTAEHYVLPIDTLREGNELTNAFEWVADHEDAIRGYYGSRLGDYLSGLKAITLNDGLLQG